MTFAQVRRLAGPGAAYVAVFAGLFVIGTLVATRQEVAVAAALGVLILGLTFVQPVALPILAMPALVVVERVGGGAANLSLSDFVLFAAFWPALFLAPRPFSPPLRALLWLSVLYQVATLFTVVTNVYAANTVEWFHAWLSVGAALIVGWAVGRAGFGRLGLNLLLLACGAIAVVTLVQAALQIAGGDTGPVYVDWPVRMHKNYVGCVLAFAAVIVYARPSWLKLRRSWAMIAFVVFTLAVLASQARQALVGLAIALLVIALRRDPERQRSKTMFFAVVGAGVFVISIVQNQLAEDNEFNSAFQRLTWYRQSLRLWDTSPWFGVGLRWWTTDRTPYNFQPPNAELEVLTSAGIVGLVGFLILFLGALAVLWKVEPRYGTLAFSILLARFVQGQFDLFWSAVVVSVPFAVVGLCLGVQAYEAERRSAGPDYSRLDSSGLDSSGLDSSGLDSSRPDKAAVHA